LKVERV